jgi:GntR family transcriptional regulator/MocR family aminotransferase
VATVDAASAPQHAAPARRFDVDFLPGSPDLSSFPRNAWLRALRQGLAEIGSDSFGYVDPQGLPAARAAVADYLRRTRGVQADAQHVVLCSGATQAIALLGRTLQDGEMPLAMEDPGFWLHRMVLRHNGIEPLAVPVDDDGLDVAALARSGATTVLSTPAHQSPTGVVLSATRRTALVEWARAGHLVIEDDYDAEYRYDRTPVGALQGLAPDRVVYAGSASKTLAPGLRLGWISAVKPSVEQLALIKQQVDPHTQNLVQLVVSRLIDGGMFDRHLLALKGEHRRRRDAVVKALQKHTPTGALRFTVPDGGLFLWCRLAGDVSALDVQERALNDSVFIVTGEPFYVDGGGARELRICFTTKPPEIAAQAARVIATSVIEATRRATRAEPISRIV